MFEIVFNRKLSERIYYSSIVFPWACLITSDFLYKENNTKSVGGESVNGDEFEAIDDKNG